MRLQSKILNFIKLKNLSPTKILHHSGLFFGCIGCTNGIFIFTNDYYNKHFKLIDFTHKKTEETIEEIFQVSFLGSMHAVTGASLGFSCGYFYGFFLPINLPPTLLYLYSYYNKKE